MKGTILIELAYEDAAKEEVLLAHMTALAHDALGGPFTAIHMAITQAAEAGSLTRDAVLDQLRALVARYPTEQRHFFDSLDWDAAMAHATLFDESRDLADLVPMGPFVVFMTVLATAVKTGNALTRETLLADLTRLTTAVLLEVIAAHAGVPAAVS